LLVTLPALALLRGHWPQARIELVGNATAGDLARRAGLVDAVHAQHEARWAALYGGSPLPPALADWLAGFALVLNYWPDPAGELARRFPVRVGQSYLAAAALPTLAPAAAHYCAPLRQLGLVPDSLCFALRAPTPSPHLVAIHPGSGSPRKNWPLDRWHALAPWLERECRVHLLIISGEAEPRDLLAGIGEPLHQLPLGELADRLAQCELFVGHDSGISHLAAATGVPLLLLFGPTDPAMWAPPTPRAQVLRSGADVAAISLADVQRAIRAALPGRT
jgi:ADP-heptose:LPS heptosyltransferase